MKKINFVHISLFLLVSVSYTQVYQEWVSRYNYYSSEGMEMAYSLAVDNYQNVYVTGLCYTGSNCSIATVKYSAKGEELWSARFNTGLTGVINKLAIDQEGYVYVMGTGIGPGGREEYALIKYNKTNGNVLWQRQFYNPQYQFNSPYAITIDKNNNIFVTGSGGTVKYNSSGQLQWFSSLSPMRSIAADPDLNVYITGGDLNFKTVKLNSDGVVLWEYNFGGTGRSVALDDSNNVYAAGFNSIYGYSLAKFSSQGNYRWFTYCPLPASADEFIPKIVADKHGNVIICGNYVNSNYSSDYQVIKYSSNGTLLWNRKYNGPANNDDWAHDIALDRNDDIYVTGVSIGDYYLQEMTTVKYSSTGDLKWVKRYINGVTSRANGIAIFNSKVFITGTGEGGGVNSDDYVTIKYSQVIGIEPISSQIPKEFNLCQNYPNPFNPATKIRFDIPAEGQRHAFDVRLIIYDLLGRVVATLVDDQLSPGEYEIIWDGSNCSAGIYCYRLISANFAATRKMILLK